MSTSSTDLDHDKARVGDERLGVIHSASHHTLGFGRNYYGIWDQGSSGAPIQRFPASDSGREAAWARYVELEPSAQEALTARRSEEQEGEEVRRGSTRRRIILLGVVVAIAVVAVVLTQINKGGGKGTTAGGGPLGSIAHLDITGASTGSEDLTQQSFKSSDFKGLFPSVQAKWSAGAITLLVNESIPKPGDLTTSQVPDRRVEITIQDATGQSVYRSVNGECTIGLRTVQEDGIAGTLDCTGVKNVADSTKTIDVKGTFAAQS